ncbi:hypothetical protein D6827_03745 [Candidatus Parcubacteria bacterium]|nr:MAG: hypothetical protein D6827_03745 [Candidatus Parcubacteria bacterium]
MTSKQAKISTTDGSNISANGNVPIKKKYILIGGYVIARDGQRHYVSAARLMRFYGIKKKDIVACIDIDKSGYPKLLGVDLDKYEVLTPKPDGNYQL